MYGMPYVAAAAEVGVELLVRAAGEDRVDVVLRVRVDGKPRDVAIPRVVSRKHRTGAERTVLVDRCPSAGSPAPAAERGQRSSAGRRRGGRCAGGGGAGAAHAARLAPSAATSATIRTLPRFMRFYRRLAGANLKQPTPTMRSGVRVDPESRERQPRPVPHVWRPARGRGGRRDVDRGNSLAAARVRLGRHHRHRVLDRGVGCHRCAPLPRDHRLPALRTRRAARVPDLEGRSFDLGRGHRRRDRGDRHHAAPAHAHAGRDGLPRAGSPHVAQAIGRWGNWFNQELFGKPTTLPWGLEISLAHRPLGYTQYTTFQPTFLYESLYCLLIVGILLLVERKLPLKLGQTFALYVIFYTFGRFWFENLRIDPAHDIGPLRVNAWVSILRLRLRHLVVLVARSPRAPPASGRPRSLGGKPRKLGCHRPWHDFEEPL